MKYLMTLMLAWILMTPNGQGIGLYADFNECSRAQSYWMQHGVFATCQIYVG